MNEETPTTTPTRRTRRRRSMMTTAGVTLAGLAASFALYGMTASATTSASTDPSRPIRVDQT
ncbi:MAG TPA: hypothetical protein VIH06_01265, partial [Ilumatobacteraceae bacterium]